MDENLIFRNEEKDVEVYYNDDSEVIIVHKDRVMPFNLNDKFDVKCFCKFLNELRK